MLFCIQQVITLGVATNNRALHLYERQGYVTKETTSLCCCGMWCLTGERVCKGQCLMAIDNLLH